MKKFALAAAIFCVTTTGLSAEVLKCKQTKLSSSGFASISAAQSWFPKNFIIAINDKEAISDPYGMGSVTEKDGRKHITFVTASAAGKKTEIVVTFIPHTRLYTAKLNSGARYAQTPGAKGKCSVS